MNDPAQTADTADIADIAVVDHVTKHYPLSRNGFGRRPHVHSVDDVSLTIRTGEVLGLVGESGSGKSTLARLLLGLVPVDSGRIEVDRLRVGKLRGARLRQLRRSAQLVFQDPHSALDPRMTLRESLLAPLEQHRVGTPQERLRRVATALTEVGLDHGFLERRPGDCSGGQLQRVVIARALLLEPKLLVCDEPVSALDASVQATILNLLVDLRRSRGLSMLFISHDLRVVEFLADRVAVLYLGQIVEMATHDDIFAGALHPYTLALLHSGRGHRIVAGAQDQLKGEPPSPVSPPPGCRFNTRCPLATDRCRTEQPDLVDIGNGHHVRCHRSAESRSHLVVEEIPA
ncbi:oligopeptide/dipeptide ABC transporter ATP-binding protein [Nonomuraea angiospora]|uniref:oligopeptide/dipeptide ABC transporter ATP-binding protein n=1 Tax=Nonomuraea angiospora TaxID=46172 RepID=UPI0037AFEF77